MFAIAARHAGISQRLPHRKIRRDERLANVRPVVVLIAVYRMRPSPHSPSSQNSRISNGSKVPSRPRWIRGCWQAKLHDRAALPRGKGRHASRRPSFTRNGSAAWPGIRRFRISVVDGSDEVPDALRKRLVGGTRTCRLPAHLVSLVGPVAVSRRGCFAQEARFSQSSL